jgi:DNA/RNA-binding domain of Phe-tRNA-synthetase-like protein
VIFADAAGQVHARRWTFRQSRRSTVSESTRRALIVSEGLHATAAADVPALLDALEKEIAGVWGAPAGRAVLTAERPRWDLQ